MSKITQNKVYGLLKEIRSLVLSANGLKRKYLLGETTCLGKIWFLIILASCPMYFPSNIMFSTIFNTYSPTILIKFFL